MIGLVLSLLLQATAPAAVPQPAEWPSLPVLPTRSAPIVTREVTRFVRIEVEQGRCAAMVRSGPLASVRVDLLVLADDDGRVRRVTPVAIRCPTVEQYAAGLVLGQMRDGLDLPSGAGWYRTSLSFTWTQ